VSTGITDSARRQIADILDRRANEIAGFAGEYRNRPEHYGSVELALTREIERLRRLSDQIAPPDTDGEDA
jgi:hypothetical protein